MLNKIHSIKPTQGSPLASFITHALCESHQETTTNDYHHLTKNNSKRCATGRNIIHVDSNYLDSVIIYKVFHKIGTSLYFCDNILPCGPISIIDILNRSAENWLKTCATFTYLTFIYYLKIVTSHPRQYLRLADI